MYVSSLSGHFIEVDPVCADMLGYGSAQEMITSIRDITLQLYVDCEMHRRMLESLIECGSICNFETQVYRKDGSTLWVSEYCRLVRSSGSGEITHLQGAFADISSYKALVQQQTSSNLHVAHELAALKGVVNGPQRRRLPFKAGTRVRFLDASKITFVRADGDYVHVHTVNGDRIIARDRISNVARRVDPTSFVRISKSTLVNVNYVKEVSSSQRGVYEFLLDTGELLACGPTYRDTVRGLIEDKS